MRSLSSYGSEISEAGGIVGVVRQIGIGTYVRCTYLGSRDARSETCKQAVSIHLGPLLLLLASYGC